MYAHLGGGKIYLKKIYRYLQRPPKAKMKVLQFGVEMCPNHFLFSCNTFSITFQLVHGYKISKTKQKNCEIIIFFLHLNAKFIVKFTV